MGKLAFRRQVFLDRMREENLNRLDDLDGHAGASAGERLGTLWSTTQQDEWFERDGERIALACLPDSSQDIFTLHAKGAIACGEQLDWMGPDFALNVEEAEARGEQLDWMGPEPWDLFILGDQLEGLSIDSSVEQVADFFEQQVLPLAERLLDEFEAQLQAGPLPGVRHLPDLGEVDAPY